MARDSVVDKYYVVLYLEIIAGNKVYAASVFETDQFTYQCNIFDRQYSDGSKCKTYEESVITSQMTCGSKVKCGKGEVTCG